MKCPRCQAALAAPDAAGFVVCAGCGARLRVRPAAPGAAAGGLSASPVAGTAREVEDAVARLPPEAEAKSSTDAGPNGARGPTPRKRENPNATLPPGTPLRRIVAPAAASSSETDSSATPATLEAILAELHELKAVQHAILVLLRSPGRVEPEAPADDFGGLQLPEQPTSAIRSRRRKTVVLVDDDDKTRQEAVAALEHAEVPVRAVPDGNAALAAIAEEKPDVIIMELDIGGAMAGKDVINMIKATMEWVDIPIVLYTRLPIENQREARQIHGADELVPKGPASAEALVTRVITVFRRG